MHKLGYRFLLMALASLLAAGVARRAGAQVIIIDHRPEIPIAHSYEIREVSVSGTIRDQVAEIQVAQTLHNPGYRELEAELLIPIPADGAVQSLTLLVDGKELPGKLMSKEEARGIYEEIVRRKRDPALMEYVGQGLYRTRVFPIPGGADRQVSIRYTQICPMDQQVVRFTHLMTPQRLSLRPIDKFKLRLRIESQTPIKSIYSPSHEIKTERTGDREALVTLEQERTAAEGGDFRLLYTLDKNPLGVTVLSARPSAGEDGYFLLLASPEIKKEEVKRQPKTVVLVLDHSGSMQGEKIRQARDSLRFCLDRLSEGDKFNVVSFNDMVESFKPELQSYNDKTRTEAERFVESIEADGGTNINEALQTALRMTAGEKGQPGYVLFMTDGLPTVGEVNELKIAETAKKENKNGARLFAFGVGYDVNARLLDRLSGGAGGASEYVRPSENIETHVSRFFSKLTSPVLSRIRITASRGDLGRMLPAEAPDLFEGGQLVIVGRYREAGEARLTVSGKVGDKDVSYEYPVKLAGTEDVTRYDFVERLWAIRRIGHLIDQIDLNGKNKELTDELTKLSTKYGILTPYTSFLADERTQVWSYEINSARAGRLMEENLGDVSGAAGNAQRAFKGNLKSAASPLAAAPPAVHLGAPGRAGGGSPAAVPQQYAYADAFDLKGDGIDKKMKQERGNNVLQMGSKTFYRKDGVWIDAGVKEDEVKKAVAIEPFSEEYFKLSRGLGALENQCLTFKEPVVVRLGGKVYRIAGAPAGR